MEETRGRPVARNAAAAAWVVVALLAILWWSARDPELARGVPSESLPVVDKATADHPRRRASDVLPAVPSAADDSPVSIDSDRVDRDLDVFGVVVRRDGSPVAGASVLAVQHPWRRALSMDAAQYGAETRGPATRSARDGTFALRLSRGESVALRVAAQGLSTLDVLGCQAGGRVRVVLDVGVRLRVSVLDDRRSPVSSVPLELVSFDEGAAEVRRRATTAADGSAVVDGLPPSERLWVQALSPRHVDVLGAVVALPASGDAQTTIVLPAGRSIRGRVTDAATGSPVRAARIGVFDRNAAHGVESREDGTYELPGWSGKVVRGVRVVADGFVTSYGDAGTRDVLDFALRRGFEVSGRVVDAQRAPVAGALLVVDAAKPGDVDRQTGASGEDGRFRVAGLDPSMAHLLDLVATSNGRRILAVSRPGPGPALDLGDVTLPAARAIEGTVTESDGTPVAGARVLASGPLPADEREPLWRTDERRTDDLGRFRFRDLGPGRYAIGVQVEGTARMDRAVDVLERDATDVSFTMTGRRQMVVRVLDETGRGVGGATVLVTSRGRTARSAADAEGAARLRVDAEADHVQAFAPESDARCLLASLPARLSADQAEATVVLREGQPVSGRLVDAQSRPIGQALVSVRVVDGAAQTVATDGDGRFRAVVPANALCTVEFDGIVVGRATDLRARSDGVAGGATELRLVAERR